MRTRLLILLAAIISLPVYPCSFIDSTPPGKDLIKNLKIHYDNSDVIWKVKIIEATESHSKFKVLEIYKGIDKNIGEYLYTPKTSCDEYFYNVTTEHIVFGQWMDGELSIFAGSSLNSKSRKYEKLDDLLKELKALGK